MGLLDIVKAGVQGTAAARSGYLTGQEEEQDKTQKDKLTALGIDRQSRLAAIAEQRAAAEDERARAQADYYRHRATTDPVAPPHTITTGEGIMQWDAGSKTFKPTGFHAPERAGDAAAPRIQAREHRIAMGQEVADANRQISDATRELKDEQGPYGDDSPSRIATLRSQITDFTRGRDSTVAARKSPTFEAKARAAGPGVVPFDPVMPGTASGTASGGGTRVDVLRSAVSAGGSNPAQADYDAAAAKYKKAIGLGIDPASAQQAYDATVALIAKRHGQVK